MYDIDKIRKDFPELDIFVNNRPNIFLDTAASALKPWVVIEKMADIMSSKYANVHRGAYTLSEQITFEFEQARDMVCHFVGAKNSKEIVFTRNATEAINLVASTWGRQNLRPGDEVLVSEAEHHANLVTWQVLRDELGFTLKVFKIGDDGSFIMDEYLKCLNEKTKLVAVTAMSNVLGTIFPIRKITDAAHDAGALVLVDACQYAVHNRMDVDYWGCDFLAFSGHKTYGPTGIGALYVRYDILANMPPYQLGGEMVKNVTYEHTTFADAPARFEAGTPATVEAIGLGAAIKYMLGIGLTEIQVHEMELTQYATEALSSVKGLSLVGTAAGKGGVFSFNIKGIHPQDLAYIINKEGVSIRTGHHCAEPLVHRMGYESVARASIGLYSRKEDIDALVKALEKAKTFF